MDSRLVPAAAKGRAVEKGKLSLGGNALFKNQDKPPALQKVVPKNKPPQQIEETKEELNSTIPNKPESDYLQIQTKSVAPVDPKIHSPRSPAKSKDTEPAQPPIPMKSVLAAKSLL